MSARLLLAVALVATQSIRPATLRSIPMEDGWSADAVALADLDGDGAREILVASHAKQRAFERRLEAWRSSRSSGSTGELERVASLALTRDAVAFAHGDVLSGGGEELVLFNAGGAFALRLGEEARPVRLVEADFLWQAADPEKAFHWEEGVRDLDGDGLADLVLPEPEGFAIAMQRRAEDAEASFQLVSRVRVPVEAPAPGERNPQRRGSRAESKSDEDSFSLELQIDDGESMSYVPLVSIQDRVPSPAWLDWDADGDLDLLLQTRTALHVWIQEAGAFAEAPQLSLALPVAADRTRELDVSYSAHVVDLDRDARADYAVFAGDKASADVRTQGLFFAQAAVDPGPPLGPPLFGPEGRPASLLVFAGFLSEPEFRDLDGDGFPELVVHTFRPDLIDQIRSAASETVEIEMFVYRNRAGALSRRPELAKSFALALDEGELEVEFLGDLSGDGLAELLVRERPEKIRVLSMRAGREGGWNLLEKPLWELGIAKEARVELVRAGSSAAPALFVLEPSQVLWVGFE